MTKIVRGGQAGSLDHIDSSQGSFRTQIAALTDAVRQLGGNAEIGSGVINDPLNAPYVLYVNPATGDDTFAGGEYSTGGTADERIALQRLECGYTEARPFRTINRAVIEAGIITAKSYYTSPLANTDLVSIVLMPGVYTIHNEAGTTAVSEWPATKSPTIAELVAFNPHSGGGLLLPRGVSLCGLDLRKTIFRPSYVPATADEAADASNRRAIFKVTGTGYYFGFTFMDKAGATTSHHLLHAFEFAGKAELDQFYSKIKLAFAGASNTGGLDPALVATQTSEYEIVGPQPAAGSQTVGTDTTLSASPYIFNCSIRSNYGLCGVYADGAKCSGFRSMVIAQFTGVSLQRDLSCWQKYVKGAANQWSTTSFASYDDYINSSPNDVRMDPDRRSFHIRAVNDAVIQEVSVFAIGQGVHHWCQSGGEITITNSNSNFGSVAGLAEGFKAKASAIDGPWNITYLSRPLSPFAKTNNLKRIYLGSLVSSQSNTATTLTLQTALTANRADPNQPELLTQEGYSLRAGDYVWVENSGGDDYRAQLATNPWSGTAPTQIKLAAAMATDNVSGNRAPGSVANVYLPLAGQRVYIRRFRDVRSTSERRYMVVAGSGGSERLPVRDYVIQPTTGAAWSERVVTVGASEASTVVAGGCNIELRYAQRPAVETTYSTSVFYRKGDVVRLDGKHWTATRDNYGTFNVADWQENYVHMEEGYAPPAYYRNTSAILVFDKDTSESSTSTTLGNAIGDAVVQAQLRSNADYQGLYQLLRNLGRTDAQAITDLSVQTEANRNLNVSTNGWAIELRRPSNIRMFGHAWEWAGYLNYTKSLPNYQGTLSPANKFTYYFTNKGGGIVYATGFNEEGLQVSPRGLEDITTGEVLALEDISSADRAIDFPTYYPKLEVDTLVVNEGIEGLPIATTTKAGAGEIARIEEIVGATTPANNSQIDAGGANFVTPAGLRYWAQWAQVVTKRPGVEVLYVVPDDAVQGSSYTFQGTAVTLAADPDRDVSADPPRTPQKACKFSRAVTFGNANASREETVQYRLANGPYWTDVQFNHIAQVVGATDKFPDSNRVALNFETTAVTPTTNVKNIIDTFSAPVFATRTTTDLLAYARRINAIVRPVALSFMQGGSITSCCWAPANTTFKNTSKFPNSIFPAGLQSLRTAEPSVPAALDRWMATDATVPANYIFDRFYGTSNIYNYGSSMVVRKCVFGAKASGTAGIGYGTSGPTVFCGASGDVSMAGCFFLGNTTATGFPLALAKGITNSTVTGSRNTQEIFGGLVENAKAINLFISFPQVYGANPVNEQYERDYDCNCLHVLDDNGKYSLMANRAATDGSRGAAMSALIGGFPAGSNLYTGGYGSYQINFTQRGFGHGIAGVFGNRDLTGVRGPIGLSAGVSPRSFYRNPSYHGSLWQRARDETRLTSNVTLAVKPGQQQLAYTNSSDNVLNIDSAVWYAGIDINSAQTVGGNLESGKFYG